MSASAPIEKALRLHTRQIPATTEKAEKLAAQRDEAVAACHAAGMTYAEIAARLNVSTSYVQIMVQRANGTPSPSRRRPEFR